jgi:hypothetical protein
VERAAQRARRLIAPAPDAELPARHSESGGNDLSLNTSAASVRAAPELRLARVRGADLGT